MNEEENLKKLEDFRIKIFSFLNKELVPNRKDENIQESIEIYLIANVCVDLLKEIVFNIPPEAREMIESKIIDGIKAWRLVVDEKNNNNPI